MAKLYPPMIENKLPAQAGNSLSIPFQHSRAVGARQYKGFSLIIKNAATLTEVDTLQTYEIEKYPLSFTLSEELVLGQFYKVQLAYISTDGVVGVYSQPGVFKYTGIPEFNLQLINTLTSELLSTYTPPEGDLGESLYSLQIDVYSPDGHLIETTGEVLHNSLNDTSNDQYDVIQLYYPYQNDILYSVNYSITTLNGYKSIKKYQGEVGEIEENSFLTCAAVPNPTQGSIKIECINSNPLPPTQGTYSDYYLIKTTATDKSVIKVFSSKGGAPVTPPVQFEYIDFNIEQNQIYAYQLVEISGLGGTAPESEDASLVIFAMTDFEDMFLSDEMHQLCIRFNPKVASFKETVQESKINTIGGRFPITFRNGNTQYKEFSIAGLISYEMDNDQLFSTINSTIGVEEVRTQTDASQSAMLSVITPSTRVAMERKFKLEVLEWLNNGQPKLFRSPTEGNYIVRLNNISLSPNEQLGRLLHSFNASAYEIAECTAQNLEKHKVIFKGREYA